MSDEKRTDDGPELEDSDVQAVPDKAIDTPETSTVDDPDALRAAHSANISTWRELSDEDREPVLVGQRRGMFGPTRGQDTSGYGGLVTPTLLPGASPRPYGSWFDDVADRLGTALTEGGGAGYHEAVEKVVVDRGELTLFVRREHLPTVARAMRDGNAPHMARWLSDTHRMVEWEPDLSSQTGASQAGILLGSNEDIPAFRWVEKERGLMMVCSSPSDCAEIERRHATGVGLLVDGGASRGNLLSGEAEVAGAEGLVRRIVAGQAAVWEPGEVHETRSPGGMSALIVEGDLDIGAPGEQVDPGDT